MATEPIQGIRYPEPGDANNVPQHLKDAVDDIVGKLVMQFPTVAARDAALTAPTEGMIAVTGTGTAQQTWQYRSGGWRNISITEWTAFTPVLTATAPNHPSGHTATGRWMRVGRLIRYHYQINFGAVPGSGAYSLSLPVPASIAMSTTAGVARLYDASSGNSHPAARAAIASTTTLALQTTSTFGGPLSGVSAAFPWTWAAGDILDGFIDYEAAA